MVLIIMVGLGFPLVCTAFLQPSYIIDSAPVVSRTTRLRVVADAPIEKEEERKNRRGEDDDQHDWIASPGGFIPNLKSRLTSNIATVFPNKKKTLTKNPMIEVTHIQQYKDEVVDERDRIVCVRFYAPWCRACKKVEASFRRLPTEFPAIKFVEVPLTKDNAYLHQGLGVPSLPFAHIYEPSVGLCEERTCKHGPVFTEFKNILTTYANGECLVEYDENVIVKSRS
jgi:thiol-disulfide isomerase/thioredoxin